MTAIMPAPGGAHSAAGATVLQWLQRTVMLASATMKVPRIIPLGVTVELDATDCVVLTDALASAVYHDLAPDPGFVHPFRIALEACAIVAATDTLRDANIPERAMLADTRRVWGAHDHATRRDDNPRSPRP